VSLTLGIDVACGAAHQATLAEDGKPVWRGRKFFTCPDDLERLWADLDMDGLNDPAGLIVVLEPTRDAWIVLAQWFRRRRARVVMVPTTQSADLRAYYSRHAKNDRLDSGSWPSCRCCIPRGCASSPVTGRRIRYAGWSSSAPIRSYSGPVPTVSQSGTTNPDLGITKAGDALLREMLFMAADQARHFDPQLAGPAHVRRPAPRLRRLPPGRDPAHPDRHLLAHRPALRPARRRRPRDHPRTRPPHRPTALQGRPETARRGREPTPSGTPQTSSEPTRGSTFLKNSFVAIALNGPKSSRGASLRVDDLEQLSGAHDVLAFLGDGAVAVVVAAFAGGAARWRGRTRARLRSDLWSLALGACWWGL
jgi:Transposase/Transposase IS116/IS110/IS902 family